VQNTRFREFQWIFGGGRDHCEYRLRKPPLQLSRLSAYFPPMIIGYFRQLPGPPTKGAAPPAAILRAQRCLRIETDEGGSRAGLGRALAALGRDDVLVSPSIDCMAASVHGLLLVVDQVHRKAATLRLVAEKIDTANPAARRILVALADYERRAVERKLKVGLIEAEARGAHPGRPPKLGPNHLDHVREQLGLGRSYASLAREFGVHPTTVMRFAGRIGEN